MHGTVAVARWRAWRGAPAPPAGQHGATRWADGLLKVELPGRFSAQVPELPADKYRTVQGLRAGGVLEVCLSTASGSQRDAVSSASVCWRGR